MATAAASTPWSAWTTPLALFLAPAFALYLPHALVITLAVCALARLAECLWFRVVPQWRQPAVLLIMALALWALASATWAIQTKAAVEGAASLLGFGTLLLFALDNGASLPEPARRRSFGAFFAGAMLATFLLLFEIISGGQLAAWLRGYDFSDSLQNELATRSLNRGVSFLGVISPLMALAAWRFFTGHRRLLALCASALGLACALSWGKDAVLLAGAGAVGCAVLVLAPNPWPKRFFSAAIISLVVLWPLLTLQLPGPQAIWEQWRAWPPSLQHRLFIWHFTAEHIAEKPVLGWGMNSAKYIPGGDRDIDVGNDKGRLQWRALPLHPHNAILQWWLELGAVGASLAAGLTILAATAICRLASRADRVAAAAVFGQICVIALLSFGAWQSWWLAAMIFAVWLIRILVPLDQA